MDAVLLYDILGVGFITLSFFLSPAWFGILFLLGAFFLLIGGIE